MYEYKYNRGKTISLIWPPRADVNELNGDEKCRHLVYV